MSLHPHRVYLLSTCLAVLVFTLIASPSGFYFLNDDFVHVPAAVSGQWMQTNFFRPVSNISLWLDGQVWGREAFGFHLTNRLIHLANAALLFGVCYRVQRRFGGPTGYGAPIFCSLLFLLYAFHSESVFWILGRGGSLTTFWILLFFLCFFARYSAFALAGGLIVFYLGLQTYESSWALPAIVLVLQLASRWSGQRPDWGWSLGTWVVFAVHIVWRYGLAGAVWGQYEGGLEGWGILAYNGAATFARIFLPPLKSTGLFALSGCCLVGILIWGLTRIWRNQRRNAQQILAGLVCLALACLPSISRGIDIHDTEGERFLYFPSVFACWVITVFVFSIRPGKLRLLAALCIIFLHLGFLVQAASAYRVAGTVVRQSLECIRASRAEGMVEAIGLPTQYRGALIFRKGFQEALDWVMPGRVNQVGVRSVQEWEQPIPPRCLDDPRNETGQDRMTSVRWYADGRLEIQSGIKWIEPEGGR